MVSTNPGFLADSGRSCNRQSSYPTLIIPIQLGALLVAEQRVTLSTVKLLYKDSQKLLSSKFLPFLVLS